MPKSSTSDITICLNVSDVTAGQVGATCVELWKNKIKSQVIILAYIRHIKNEEDWKMLKWLI